MLGIKGLSSYILLYNFSSIFFLSYSFIFALFPFYLFPSLSSFLFLYLCLFSCLLFLFAPFFTSFFLSLCFTFFSVVYFDQQMGAPHAVCWSKSIFSALKQVFSSFSITNGKKKGKRKETQNNTKNMWKGGIQALRCYAWMNKYKLKVYFFIFFLRKMKCKTIYHIFTRSQPAFGCQPAFQSNT